MSLVEKEWYSEVPRSIRPLVVVGFTLGVIAFGGFGAWAFHAPLAAAVIAHGSFVATGQNKIVQHLEGGIIADILVAEGDHVTVGQPLVRLDQTSAEANQRELYLRRIRLEAIEARLMAEYGEVSELVLPPHVVEAAADPEVEAIIDSQTLNFEVSTNSREKDLALLTSNIEAMKIRSGGYHRQIYAYRAQLANLKEELESKNSLVDLGLVRKTEVRAIERALAEAQGELGRLLSQVDEIVEVEMRNRTEIEQMRAERRQAALKELQGIQADLDSTREQERKAESVLKRAVVASPVAGTVVRLFYHTPGGVIESGKPIAELLPADAPLIIEAAVSRNDIDSVIPGQHAAVRLTALNARVTPILNGNVEYVSADAIADRSDGVTREVYLARITLSAEELARVPHFTPLPGMPADVMIKTEERTFAQYIVKPIRDSMSRAFLEQ